MHVARSSEVLSSPWVLLLLLFLRTMACKSGLVGRPQMIRLVLGVKKKHFAFFLRQVERKVSQWAHPPVAGLFFYFVTFEVPAFSDGLPAVARAEAGSLWSLLTRTKREKQQVCAVEARFVLYYPGMPRSPSDVMHRRQHGCMWL